MKWVKNVVGFLWVGFTNSRGCRLEIAM